jgi:hypothetical protein
MCPIDAVKLRALGLKSEGDHLLGKEISRLAIS